MQNIINTSAESILETFQTAFFRQIGKRMQIGSEEYTLSTVFSYALSVYAALVNNSYRNQLTETASGVFLDNIAARYNLKRRGEDFSHPWFEGLFSFNYDCEYYGRRYSPGELEIVVRDHVYSNQTPISDLRSVAQAIRWVAIDEHSDFLSLSELHESLLSVTDSKGEAVFSPTYISSRYVSGLEDANAPMDDESFRKYIETAKFLYVPGVARSFESVAVLSSPFILSARVRVQRDAGFIPGNVDLFCKDIVSSIMRPVVDEIDIPTIIKNIEARNISVVGQSVNVYSASRISDERNYRFFIDKKYDSPAYKSLYLMKFNAVLRYLNRFTLKVCEDFYPSVLFSLMMRNLSEIISNPEDIGIYPDTNYPGEDEPFANWEKYRDLPVLGVDSVSSYERRQASPSSFVYLPIAQNSCEFSFV